MKSTQHHCETLYFVWKKKYVKQHIYKTCGFFNILLCAFIFIFTEYMVFLKLFYLNNTTQWASQIPSTCSEPKSTVLAYWAEVIIFWARFKAFVL